LSEEKGGEIRRSGLESFLKVAPVDGYAKPSTVKGETTVKPPKTVGNPGRPRTAWAAAKGFDVKKCRLKTQLIMMKGKRTDETALRLALLASQKQIFRVRRAGGDEPKITREDAAASGEKLKKVPRTRGGVGRI